MSKKDIIVIGASAGGFPVIIDILTKLPATFNASIFIVWHMPAVAEGFLHTHLNKNHSLPASVAAENELIRPGRIYIAPPDNHLIIQEGRTRLSTGPKENGFRPAIDPLFRSAALNYGNRVAGVILSGALDDGVAGLWMIKECGGVAIVQDPGDAAVPSMPAHALQAVDVDYCLPPGSIHLLLIKLASEEKEPGRQVLTPVQNTILYRQAEIALQNSPKVSSEAALGAPGQFTCPECKQPLGELKEGGHLQYKCPDGHVYSADNLLGAIGDNITTIVKTAMKGINESIALLNHIGDHFAHANMTHIAAAYFCRAKETAKQTSCLQDALDMMVPRKVF
ncbi:MAG TPA: chemotaxis protein CheB [Chitinophagaceae bacterium]|nr:chemotaxis protein CheB [Chitinophagaceae bacterium]